ncbi:unannotated protein [freshwater metagenome]|uniref:Unannotated protein n=1 Tax=freshwater metagenome TaxID=449393 RepID=A0A6J6VWU0_9ZZZZ
MRMAMKRSRSFDDDGPSVPSPTVAPAASRSGTRHTPDASLRFESGQCAMAVLVCPRRVTSSSLSTTACASTVVGPSSPWSSNNSIGVRP